MNSAINSSAYALIPPNFGANLPANNTTNQAQTDPTKDKFRDQDALGVLYSGEEKYADKESIGQRSDRPSTYDALEGIAKQQNAENAQLKEQEKADQEKIQELKDRDQEVRIHEQAHAAVGGQYAGAPTYEFETGPDGNRYAVGGEVSIDVSEEKDPKDTISKMRVVRAAALAPAEPSAQDYKVANEASQKEQRARADMAKESVSGKAPEGHSASATDTATNTSSPGAALHALRAYEITQQPVVAAFSAQA